MGHDDYQLDRLTQAEADEAIPVPAAGRIVAPDFTRAGIVDLDESSLGDLGAIGGKAAHLAELRKIAGISVPRALAVPMSGYRAFVTDAGLQPAIERMLLDPGFQDPALRRQAVTALGEAMAALRVDPGLLAAVARTGHQRVVGRVLGTSIRLERQRSSSMRTSKYSSALVVGPSG